MDEEKRCYQTVKRMLHNPDIGNADAGKLVEEFRQLHPHSVRGVLLRMKWIWFRKLNVKGIADRAVTENFLDLCLEQYRHRIDCIESHTPEDVLLFSHELTLTGAPRALLGMAMALRKAGFRPVILAPQSGSMAEEAEACGITVIVDPGLSVGRLDRSLVESFVATFPTIVFNTIPMMLKAGLFGNVPGRKIGWVHESAMVYDDLGADVDFAGMSQLFDEIYVVGEYAGRVFHERTGCMRRTEDLLYAIEPYEPSAGKRPHKDNGAGRRLVMLMAGTVDRRKGADVLAGALSLMPGEVRERIHIDIVGRQIDARIAGELRKWGDGVVDLKGELPHDEVLRMLTDADMLLCPSIDDPMPIVCTEAMEQGKPVLTTTNTGTASFIRDGVDGFVVEAGNAGALAEKIAEIVAIRDSLPETGKRGREIYEKYFTTEVFDENIRRIFSSNTCGCL